MLLLIMQWLEKDFLGYLQEWTKSVKERGGFDDQAKQRMMLSRETADGLKMTGNNHNACKFKHNFLLLQFFPSLRCHVIFWANKRGCFCSLKDLIRIPLKHFLDSSGQGVGDVTTPMCLHFCTMLRQLESRGL